MFNKDFYRGKKVFITGNTGFKGAWLSQILLLLGAEITGYSLEPTTEVNLYDILGLSSQYETIKGDVRDAERLENALKKSKADLMIHLAAQAIVSVSYTHPALTFETNVMGTLNAFEALRKTETVRSFINVTTDKVYENLDCSEGYREDDRLCGQDPYSNSKSCSELVTFSYKKSFFSFDNSPAISSARSGNVIGGGDFNTERLVPNAIHSAMNNKPIPLRLANSVRPFQHVLECLSGYLMLLEKQYNNKALQGAYNFAPDITSTVTIEELAKIFCKKWGDGLTYTVENKENFAETAVLRLNNSKAEEILGWVPNWSIEKAIEKSIEWAKAYYQGEGVQTTTKQINEFFGF